MRDLSVPLLLKNRSNKEDHPYGHYEFTTRLRPFQQI